MNKNEFVSLNISIFVVSDSRNERSDKSGKILNEKISSYGHNVLKKEFITDDYDLIKIALKKEINNPLVDVIILTGGTGLTGRDSTPEAVKFLINREIPGFGEMFRVISFRKIGTSSLQSRALGGVSGNTFIFALPGSPSACLDAWEEILKHQLDIRTKPCNLVELIPRLKE